jgi:hypothetical protein
MPLWQIFHPEGTFPDEESKRAFSADITKQYTTKVGLPAFYVVVQYFKMPAGDQWVGGEIPSGTPFIRVLIYHVAVVAATSPLEFNAHCKVTTDFVDEAMKPHIQDKGYDWEYQIAETDRGMWKLNGLIPPPWKSEEERQWVEANKALPWDGGH